MPFPPPASALGSLCGELPAVYAPGLASRSPSSWVAAVPPRPPNKRAHLDRPLDEAASNYLPAGYGIAASSSDDFRISSYAVKIRWPCFPTLLPARQPKQQHFPLRARDSC